jgi:hypothetical protein
MTSGFRLAIAAHIKDKVEEVLREGDRSNQQTRRHSHRQLSHAPPPESRILHVSCLEVSTSWAAARPRSSVAFAAARQTARARPARGATRRRPFVSEWNSLRRGCQFAVSPYEQSGGCSNCNDGSHGGIFESSRRSLFWPCNGVVKFSQHLPRATYELLDLR